MRIILLLALTMQSYRIYAAPAPAPPTVASVFVETAKPKTLFRMLTFPARVESRVNAVIRAEADGAVTEILKPLGHTVHRGEPVAIIRHTDPVYEYAPLNVIASVDGVVNDVQVTPGSLVNKGDSIVTVTDPNRLRIMIEVAALDLPYVHAGQTVEFYVSGRAEPFHAHVKGVSPSIDPMLGTASCELGIVSADSHKVLAGMVGKVQFKVNGHDGILLPESAIVYKGDQTFVRTVHDGHAQRIKVTLGDHNQGMVEILSGVKAGDEVIDRTSRFVADGEAVQVETAHE